MPKQQHTQNYEALVFEYKALQKYNPHSGSNTTCLICGANNDKSQVILFPCEHICMCEDCASKSMISPKSARIYFCKKDQQCPACHMNLHLALPRTGNLQRERDQYWNWLLSGPPSFALPKDFSSKFAKQSLSSIQEYLNPTPVARSSLRASLAETTKSLRLRSSWITEGRSNADLEQASDEKNSSVCCIS